MSALGFIRVVVCLFAAAAQAKVISPGALRVHVLDFAQVPKNTLRRAVDQARGLLHVAGVDTVWAECADCTLPGGGTEIEVNILPRSQNSPASKEALGYTLRPQGEDRSISAYIYYGRVEDVSPGLELYAPALLATVMVHEICHLFGLEHTREGIMRAKFRRTDLELAAMGQLLFAPGQAKVLRAAVVERLRDASRSALASLP